MCVCVCVCLLVHQLDFAQQRLFIPEGLSLTLKDLALGRARKTSGQGIPFFVGACDNGFTLLPGTSPAFFAWGIQCAVYEQGA